MKRKEGRRDEREKRDKKEGEGGGCSLWAGVCCFFSRRSARFVRQAPRLTSNSLASSGHASVDHTTVQVRASHHDEQLNAHTTFGSCSASSLNMIVLTQLFILCLAGLPSVCGNVEKEIFVAPHEPQELFFTGPDSGQSAELEALHSGLPLLTPSSHCRTTEPCRSVQIPLNTSFLDGGEKQWVLLDHLEPGRRYEVRICWAATVSLYPFKRRNSQPRPSSRKTVAQ